MICTDEGRSKNQICVVENIADLWALEKSEVFNGLYHVLGGNLSAINSIGPDDLNLKNLLIELKVKKLTKSYWL